MRIDRIDLKDFRNFESLTLSFDQPRTLIVGPNGSGKSTIIDAIAWVLTGHCRGTDARGAGAKTLVRDGADRATVTLHLAGFPPITRTVGKDGGTQATVKPEVILAKLDTNDAAVTACLYSRAFFDFHHADAKDLLTRLLDVHVDAALVPELGLTDPIPVDALAQFYQDAFNRRGAAKKALAGLRVPDPPKVQALDAGPVADVDLDTLRETVKLTRQSWKALTTQAAQAKAVVDGLDGDLRRWEALAADTGIADRRKIHQDAIDAGTAKAQALLADQATIVGATESQVDLDRAKAQAQAVIDRIGSHDPAVGCVLDRAIPCLTDAKEFAGRGKAAAKMLKDLTVRIKAADQARRKALELEGQIREVNQGVQYAQNQVAKLDDQAQKAAQAADQVAKLAVDLGTAKAKRDDLAAQAARLEAEVGKLETKLDQATQYQAATVGRADALATKARLEQEVTALDALVDKLGPKGVQVVALTQAIGEFEAAVNAALALAGFELTFGADPWGVRVNGRPYDLLSDGEKLTVGTAFQNALAAISGLDLVIVDATETTVGTLRQAVTTTLMMSPIGQALIAVAKPADDPVPDIDGLQVVRLPLLPKG